MRHTPDPALTEFSARFGRTPELVVRSPGRANLIGDHTDYNDGFVLPMATEQALWLATAIRTDRKVRVSSPKLGDGQIDLDRLAPTRTWLDYVAGTLQEIDARIGFDMIVHSELPTGAGLSSSAALEMGVARLGTIVGGKPWHPIEAAHAAQRAETQFVGVPCGIMDQLTVATAVQGKAMFIDCRSLDTILLPIPEAVTVVVLDTGTRRRLLDTRYQTMREACSKAAAQLGVKFLRDAEFDQVETSDLSPGLKRVARHVVTENGRTRLAAQSLEAVDLERLGGLMNQSHASLRDDFGVSSFELDLITDLARRQVGCLGARMTGAGFAGSAVALVRTKEVDVFMEGVSNEYLGLTGNQATIFPTRPVRGVTVEWISHSSPSW